MRIKSSIFVSALIRQETGQGAFAVVLNKGAEDAGAIYIAHMRGLNSVDFYGPAPQMFLDDANPSERFFELLASGLSENELSTLIESQLRFDSDCWVVEIEKSEPINSIMLISSD